MDVGTSKISDRELIKLQLKKKKNVYTDSERDLWGYIKRRGYIQQENVRQVSEGAE
jgi:hypothetical protein